MSQREVVTETPVRSYGGRGPDALSVRVVIDRDGSCMFIARVVGSAVSTAKDVALRGDKLLLVRRTDPVGEPIGDVFVAVDGAGSGTGELVLVVTGSAARFGERSRDKPVDALVVGVLDSMDIDGTDVYQKG